MKSKARQIADDVHKLLTTVKTKGKPAEPATDDKPAVEATPDVYRK